MTTETTETTEIVDVSRIRTLNDDLRRSLMPLLPDTGVGRRRRTGPARTQQPRHVAVERAQTCAQTFGERVELS